MNFEDSAIAQDGVFYFQHLEDRLLSEDRRSWCSHEDVQCITAPVLAITFADGLWHELNRRHGTLFDLFEEQEIPGRLLTDVADGLEQFGTRYIGVDIVEWTVATQNGVPVMASVRGALVSAELCSAAAFLRRAAIEGQEVVVSL